MYAENIDPKIPHSLFWAILNQTIKKF